MKTNRLQKIILMTAILAVAGTMRSFAGTDAAAFLNNGIGGKAMGMGGAFTSVCDDVTAIYWNPAGLARLNRFGITAMGQSLASSKWDTLDDITPSYQFIGVMVPVNSFSLPLINNTSNTFGFGCISSSLSKIPYTTLSGSGEIVRDTMEDTENAYFLSYGFPVWESAGAMYFGVTGKYITQQFSKISDATATGYDMDAGLLYRYGSLGLGAVLERGVEMKWSNGHRDTSPLTARLGISNTFFLSETLSLVASGDVVQRQNQPVVGNIGTEFGYRPGGESRVFNLDGLFLRLGADGFALENRYGYKDYINNNFNYTAGLGIGVSFLGHPLQLDYAFGSYRLGDQSRVSLNLYF